MKSKRYLLIAIGPATAHTSRLFQRLDTAKSVQEFLRGQGWKCEVFDDTPTTPAPVDDDSEIEF